MRGVSPVLVVTELRELVFVPPMMGGMVLATSKRTKDRKSPLGA